jgi:hypothetical protein
MVVTPDWFSLTSARGVALLAAALLLASPGARSQQQVIRVGTTPKPAATVPTQPAGEMQLTAYTGFGRLGPSNGLRTTPLELDLTVAFAKCSDGNVEINTLHIGGWRYNVAGVCENALDDGLVSVHGIGTTSVIATTRSSSEDDPSKVIRCDPATWRCGPAKR